MQSRVYLDDMMVKIDPCNDRGMAKVFVQRKCVLNDGADLTQKPSKIPN